MELGNINRIICMAFDPYGNYIAQLNPSFGPGGGGGGGGPAVQEVYADDGPPNFVPAGSNAIYTDKLTGDGYQYYDGAWHPPL